MVFGALQIINNIESYEEKVQKKINVTYYHRTIDELKEVGFEYFQKAITKAFILTNKENKDIISTSGIMLIYKRIVLAVTNEGVYINKPIDLNDDIITLSFKYHVKFNTNMYSNINKIIQEFIEEV